MILGIDEVGRGCWAGPLVAGAVMLDTPIVGLADSKVLSKKQRASLDPIIRATARAYGLGWVWPAEIDEHGLTWAVRTAMERAVALVAVGYDEIIVDGAYNYLAANPKARTLVKADALVPEVSAASIIAKVARDTYMAALGEPYAPYGFGSHVGYGTAAHRKALERYGVSDIHRRSYKPIQKFLAEMDQL